MNARQQRLKDALYDDIQTYRFVKLTDQRAPAKLDKLILKIDEVLTNEILSMSPLIRDHKTGRIAKLTYEDLT